MLFHGVDKALEVKADIEKDMLVWRKKMKFLTETYMFCFNLVAVTIFSRHGFMSILLAVMILSTAFVGYKCIESVYCNYGVLLLVLSFSYAWLSMTGILILYALIGLYLVCFYKRASLEKFNDISGLCFDRFKHWGSQYFLYADACGYLEAINTGVDQYIYRDKRRELTLYGDGKIYVFNDVDAVYGDEAEVSFGDEGINLVVKNGCVNKRVSVEVTV